MSEKSIKLANSFTPKFTNSVKLHYSILLHSTSKKIVLLNEDKQNELTNFTHK